MTARAPQLGEDFGIRNDTIGLAMSYFDRYLSLQTVDKADVQLVTVACILIAAKFGERQMPSLADLEFVCRGKYTAENIRHAEQDVLTHLGWELQATTPHMFCAHFLFAVVDEPARASLAFRHAEFLIDLSYYGAHSEHTRASHTHRRARAPSRRARLHARCACARTGPSLGRALRAHEV